MEIKDILDKSSSRRSFTHRINSLPRRTERWHHLPYVASLRVRSRMEPTN